MLHDFIVIMTAAIAARIVYSGVESISLDDIGTGTLAASIFVLVGRSQSFYRLGFVISPMGHLREILISFFASLLFVTLLFFCLKTGSDHSRLVMGLICVVAAPALCIGRLLAGRVLERGIEGGWVKGTPAILIGERAELTALTSAELVNFGICEVARLNIGGGDTSLSESDGRTVQFAIDLARDNPSTEFALLMAWSSHKAIEETTRRLREAPVSVKLYPDSVSRGMWLKHRGGGVHSSVSVELQREPLRRGERYAKRSLDIALASVAVLFLAPIFLIAAILIKLETRGPVIFKQKRRGFDQNTFVIYKFRTMTVLEDGDEIQQATKGDVRVTRVGKILRSSSIDELPQLFNVLRGEMSLVGPRPHALAHDAEYSSKISEYARRHHVKPGLTGAAQVQGHRGETRTLKQMAERVEWDLWYINNWSFGLDLWILLRTFIALLKHDVY